MRNNREQYFAAVDSSVDNTGAAVNASYLLAISAQAIQTGTSTGTLKFQASNDPLVGAAPTNWTDIASQTVSIAAAGTVLIPKFEICYQWVRLVYTHTNGAAGTLTVNINALGF